MSTEAINEGEARPTISSLQDLKTIQSLDSETNQTKYTACYHVAKDEKIWFGQIFKRRRDITLSEYSDALEPVPDEELFPKVPEGVALTLAPDHLIDENAWVKRPGMNSYESFKGTTYGPEEILSETLAMEKPSKLQHPHIVPYLGCRGHRGRITSLFIERHEQTLDQYAREPKFAQLDTVAFNKALNSAINAIHGLGLAHNDLKPHNIMTGGTMGWVEKDTDFSSREPGYFAMRKLPGWLEEKEEGVS